MNIVESIFRSLISLSISISTMKHLLLFVHQVFTVCSAYDYERIACQNRGIFNRNSAWDGTRTLPSKVQFGASVAYSPPE